MNRSSTPKSISIPLSASPVQTTFYIQKDKATTSVGDNVSRSPIVPHEITTSGKRKKRDVWSMQEDALLGRLVKSYPRGQPHWKGIADDINISLGSSRNGKQCRERWRNHLRPNIKKGEWTVQEEQMIHKMYKTFGPKWTAMTQYLSDRTDNDIKNKWYSMYRSAHAKERRSRDASQLAHAIKRTCQQSDAVTNHADWASQPNAAADFPPPFSLTPITTGRKTEAIKTKPTPPDDSEPLTEAAITFTYSWSDLTF